jgi:hypothetical protein
MSGPLDVREARFASVVIASGTALWEINRRHHAAVLMMTQFPDKEWSILYR